MTSMLAVPDDVAVNVADAAPLTKFALAPESVPTAGVVLMNVAGKGGKPFNSTVKSGPTFLFLMSALMVDVPPAQIVLGLAFAWSCKYVAGKMLPDELR